MKLKSEMSEMSSCFQTSNIYHSLIISATLNFKVKISCSSELCLPPPFKLEPFIDHIKVSDDLKTGDLDLDPQGQIGLKNLKNFGFKFFRI